jgi:predicted outer membrane repeat protein
LNGGGINISTGFVTVDQDSCIQNNSALNGGGIFAGDTVFITIGGGSVTNRGFIFANTAIGSGGGIYMDVNVSFVGNHARFFSNSAPVGSAFFSFGGSSSSNGPNVGRSCINCCIVNNGGVQAVFQVVNGLNSNFSGNWWGSDFGPYIPSAGPNTASGTSTGDDISGNGISAVDVGIVSIPASYGSESTGGDSDWLRIVDGDVPSDCVNDICTQPSTANRGARMCTVVKPN